MEIADVLRLPVNGNPVVVNVVRLLCANRVHRVRECGYFPALCLLVSQNCEGHDINIVGRPPLGLLDILREASIDPLEAFSDSRLLQIGTQSEKAVEDHSSLRSGAKAPTERQDVGLVG